MKNVLLLVCLFLIVANIYSQVEIYAPAYPPLVYPDSLGNSSNKGLSTEIVIAAVKITGLEYDIKINPWPRAYNNAQSTINVLIYPIIRNDERDEIFEWIGPVNKFEYIIYTRSNSSLPLVNSLEELKEQSIAVLTNDITTNYLEGLGFSNLYEISEVNSMVLLLINNRVDYIVISPTTLVFEIHKQNLSIDEVEKVLVLDNISSDPYSYLAIKKGSDKEIITSLKKAFKSMEDSGEWERIYKKYTE